MTFFQHKKYFIYIGLILLTGLFFSFNMSSIPTEVLKVAVLDGERLKKDAFPFERVTQIMAAEIEKVRQEFLPYQNNLEVLFAAVKAEKNQQKAQKKKEEFDKKKAEIEQIFIKKQEYLHNIQTHLSNTLNDAVLKVVQEIAKKKNIQIIHNRFVEDKLLIFYHDPVLDITNQVIAQVSLTLKDIAIPTELKNNDTK